MPYLEFSQIWNCWLPETAIAFDREAVVSDSSAASQPVGRIPRPPGCHFCRVPRHSCRRRLPHADLQQPRRARLGSDLVRPAIGGVLVCGRGLPGSRRGPGQSKFCSDEQLPGRPLCNVPKKETSAEYGDWPMVEERLRQAALLRGGAVSRATQMKVASLTILEANVAADWIPELERHLAGLPRRTPQLPESCPLYLQVLAAIESATQRATPSDAQLCAAVAALLPAWLALDRHEILRVARCRQ